MFMLTLHTNWMISVKASKSGLPITSLATCEFRDNGSAVPFLWV